MRVIVRKNQILRVVDNQEEVLFNYGSEEIRRFGFQTIDNAVDKIVLMLTKDEEVFVEGEDKVESKMLARKLEDRLKREVHFNFGK